MEDGFYMIVVLLFGFPAESYTNERLGGQGWNSYVVFHAWEVEIMWVLVVENCVHLVWGFVTRVVKLYFGKLWRINKQGRPWLLFMFVYATYSFLLSLNIIFSI